MTDLSEPLAALAAACGVATEYWDWRGEHVEVPRHTVVAVLAALGWAAGSEEDAERSLGDLVAERASRTLPPVLTVRQGEAGRTVPVHVPHGSPVTVWVGLESGGRIELDQLDHWVHPSRVAGMLIGEATFALPAELPLGWHTLHAETPAQPAEHCCPLVVTPARLELPAGLRRRTWGYQAQLYQVRTAASWGMGDLADLGELLEFSAGLGAGFAVINPLHAPAPLAPIEPSPYLPATRRFVSPLYLRVADVPEYSALPAGERGRLDALGAGLLAAAGPDELIDRDAVWAAKSVALSVIHAAGCAPDRQAAFDAFRRREGAALRDWATWSALVEAHGPEWMTWPEELRDPAGPAVAAERERLATRVDFHAWLQWQLDEQLAAAARRGAAAGMPIGIIGDLAVGVHPGGAESWALREVLASGVSVGAPPDAFTQQGQDWSQPPWKPNRLDELGYAPFRDMIRSLLRHAGGIRVDHVMGLFRLWWVPKGASPVEGTYVRYDHEAMVGILALEAHRAGAVVIGEDLGTVEPWVREYLAERGILGTSILFFERDDHGPKPAHAWRELCLGTVTTHDLPPTAGYLTGEHVAIRDRLGLLGQPAEQEWAQLAGEIESWRERLRAEGIDPGPPGEVDALVLALHRFLARTPVLLCGIALADAVGDRRTLNQPGTYREYPNWQLPLRDAAGRPVLLSDLRSASLPRELADVFAAEASGADGDGFATLRA